MFKLALRPLEYYLCVFMSIAYQLVAYGVIPHEVALHLMGIAYASCAALYALRERV